MEQYIDQLSLSVVMHLKLIINTDVIQYLYNTLFDVAHLCSCFSTLFLERTWSSGQVTSRWFQHS